MKDGYGVVTDDKGNKVFRLAWEKNKPLSSDLRTAVPDFTRLALRFPILKMFLVYKKYVSL